MTHKSITGRFVQNEPRLQQINTESYLAQQMKAKLIEARMNEFFKEQGFERIQDSVIIPPSADYAAIEKRMMAILSGEEDDSKLTKQG